MYILYVTQSCLHYTYFPILFTCTVIFIQALLKTEHVLTDIDEKNVLQQYSIASECLENNFMHLLMLEHTYPNDACDYPNQVRDIQLRMTPKLPLICGMLHF